MNHTWSQEQSCLLNVEVPSPFPLEGCRSDNTWTCVPPHSTLSGVDPIIASDVKTTVKTTLSSKLRSHFCWLPPQVYIFVYTLSFPQEASFIVWISAGVAQRRVVRSHTDKKNEQMLEQIKVMKNHMCPGLVASEGLVGCWMMLGCWPRDTVVCVLSLSEKTKGAFGGWKKSHLDRVHGHARNFFERSIKQTWRVSILSWNLSGPLLDRPCHVEKHFYIGLISVRYGWAFRTRVLKTRVPERAFWVNPFFQWYKVNLFPGFEQRNLFPPLKKRMWSSCGLKMVDAATRRLISDLGHDLDLDGICLDW